MPPNDTYDADALAALVEGLDSLGLESTALLRAAKPAIRRAIERGATSAAIRQEINRSSGIKLSPGQFLRLLEAPDDDDYGATTQGVFAQALAARNTKSRSSSGPPSARRHDTMPIR